MHRAITLLVLALTFIASTRALPAVSTSLVTFILDDGVIMDFGENQIWGAGMHMLASRWENSLGFRLSGPGIDGAMDVSGIVISSGSL